MKREKIEHLLRHIHWVVPETQGDFNLLDLRLLAEEICDLWVVVTPPLALDVEGSILLVECVEYSMVPENIIRFQAMESLTNRMKALSDNIKDQSLLPYSDEENLVVALLVWYGCISMAKLISEEYRLWGNNPYKLEEVNPPLFKRQELYNILLESFDCSGFQQGKWVRYGMSLAKFLKESRGEKIIDYWVPKESDYWSKINVNEESPEENPSSPNLGP